MMRHNMTYRSATWCAACTFIFYSATSVAVAGTFNWGDLSDPAGDVMYLNVEEDNLLAYPVYDQEPGVGSPDVVGNSITFDPQNFESQSSGGSAHMIDSEMSTTIMAKPGKAIATISIAELGDYTLEGLDGGSAEATVGASFFWTIEALDGVAVGGMPTVTDNMSFTTGGGMYGGEYSRPGDDGTAVIWEGNMVLDVGQWLNDNGYAGRFATKVRLRFDNTLTTSADAVSNAFIKKKEIGGSVVVVVDTNNIPEPTTVVLAGMALAGLVCVRRFAAS